MSAPNAILDQLGQNLSNPGVSPFDLPSPEAAAGVAPQAEPTAPTGEEAEPEEPGIRIDDRELNVILDAYLDEAREARRTGLEDREETWRANWDAYWSRVDTRYKAEWQAAESLPEVPNFVDRFVASLRLALVRGRDWMSISDPTDRDQHLKPTLTKFVKTLLDHSATNVTGQPIGFDATFADCAKAGAMMVFAASVSVEDGKVMVAPVDGRELYYDPTGRGLYRCRRREIDFHELKRMKNIRRDLLDRIHADVIEENRVDRERSSGHGDGDQSSRRKPIVYEEWLATLLDEDGEDLGKGRKQLVVRINEKYILRGPEPNPFWHGHDWIVMMPAVQVPFSVWGRTWVEMFRSLAGTFEELTNLILDSVYASALSGHMWWGDAIANPTDLQNGIRPGVSVEAREDWPPGKPFIEEFQVGRFHPELVTVWQGIKAELREGSGQNELSLGQVPPKGDITAREIDASTQGSSALTMNLATDIDTRFIAVLLELVFWTGLQTFDGTDERMNRELGQDVVTMILNRRDEFRDRHFTVRASAISDAVDRGRRVRALLGALNVIGSNPVLVEEFRRDYSVQKLIRKLLLDMDLDPTELEKTAQEKAQDAERAKTALAAAAAKGGQGSIANTDPGRTS